jgi:hypothetical protein
VVQVEQSIDDGLRDAEAPRQFAFPDAGCKNAWYNSALAAWSAGSRMPVLISWLGWARE